MCEVNHVFARKLTWYFIGVYIINKYIDIVLISCFLSTFCTQDLWMNFTRLFQIFKEEYRKRKTL